MKKVFLLLSFIGSSVLMSHAQDFEFKFDVADQSTTGSEDHLADPSTSDDWDYIKIDNEILNTSEEDFIYSWQVLEGFTVPEGWNILGLCDNKLCRTPWLNGDEGPLYGTPNAWITGEIQTSLSVPARGSSTFYMQVAAPQSAENATIEIKVRVWNERNADTTTFKLTKTPLGIEVVNKNDERIKLLPNPVQDQLMIETSKDLAVNKIQIINLLGQLQLSVDVPTNQTKTVVNTANLSAGMYMVRLTNDKGAVVSSRKLVKN